MVLVITRSSQAAARYTPVGGVERCSQCRFFNPQGTCGRIIGPVSPRGWCKYYSREMAQRYNPGGSLQSGGPLTPPAALDLSLIGPTLPGGLTFARTSVATYFDAAGTIQTATAATPRFSYDPVTLAPRGLLIETASTNLLLNSATLGTQSAAVTAQAYTLSFYGTGTVTLSGTSTAGPLVGAGAFPQRVALTFTPTAGTLTLTVTGSVLNAQLEAGPFATSWITTAGATATRTAETCSVPVAGWFAAAQGTLAVEGIMPQLNITGASGNQDIAGFDDGTTGNCVIMRNSAASFAMASAAASGGAAQSSAVAGNPMVAGATFKGAITYNAGAMGVVLNGGNPATPTAGTAPVSLTRLVLHGMRGVAQNGFKSRIRYWPTVLTTAQLQAITT